MPNPKRSFIALCMALLVFLILLLSLTDTSASQARVLFGPEVFTRTSGPTDVYTRSFTVPSYVSAPYSLNIKNGNPDGTKMVAIEDAVSSGSVWINGVKVVSENEFSKTVAYIEKTISLGPTNTLVIRLDSAPESYITITISGVINLGNLDQPRSGHTANLLPDGKVLITGGSSGSGILSSAEVFDPSTLSFTPLANSLTTPRTEHTATLLPDSDTLLIAGKDPIGPLFTAELFDLASGSFTEINNILKNLRSGHTATLLPDGRVLIVGGVDPSDIPLHGAEVFDPRAAVLFDPLTGTFKALSNTLTTARANHTATLLPDGRVLIIGGKNDSGILSSIEVFDPATESFTLIPAILNTPRHGHTATLLPGGRVLIIGGSDGSSTLSSAEVFDPNSSTSITSSNTLNTPRFNHTATLLTNDEVLITGGENQSGILTQAEFFGPPTMDTSIPTVRYVSPASGAEDVDLNPIISVLFSESINVTTLSTSTFTLTDPQSTISGKVSPGESGLLAFFIPGAPLAAGTTYTINLSSGINDTSGNPLSPFTSTFTTSAAPTITGFSPTSGPVGTLVTITGTNFDATATVLFNGVQATVSSITATTITTSVPSGATTGPITVTTVSGTATSITDFTVLYQPAITGFTPTSGPVGTAVTITGTGFALDPTKNTVSFNNKNAIITSSSETTITAIVPQGAETGPITVSTPSGSATSSNDFVVTPSEDFTIAASPAQATVVQGDTINYQITITSTGTNPFQSQAEVSVTGSPQGAITTFTPSKYITTAKGIILTVDTKGVSTIGGYDTIINATATIDGKIITKTAPVRLDIISAGGTTLTGTILASKDNSPLKGVKVTIGSITVYTDEAGNFLISNPPLGDQVLLIDADTANTQNASYPSRLPVPVMIISGKLNKLPYQVYIHEVNTKYFTQINPSTDTIATDPNIPDFEIKIPAGVNIIGWDSQPNTKVSMTKVPLDRLPTAPLPGNVNTRSVYMFYFGKPGGGRPTQPIPVIFPNDLGAEPGEVVDLYYYDEEPTPDPNSHQWKKLGTGKVTSDGKRIVSDPGVGIPKFCCGAAFPSRQTAGAPQPAPPDGLCPLADPVDPSAGLFFIKETDITLPGLMPVSITRTYRTLEAGVGPFGIGSSFNYDLYLLPSGSQALLYILPDGGRYLFSLQLDGTYTNSNYPFLRGVVVTAKPDGTYQMKFKDGMVYIFDSSGRLIEQRNKNNDSLNFTRDNNGTIISITEPKGRTLYFTSGPGFFTTRGWVYLITSITDPIGRRVEYNYDPSGRLIEVINPEGGITRYNYDTSNRIASIINPRGITVVTNQYDPWGRIIQQTHADGGIFNLNYTIAGSAIIQTEVTDPLGNTTTYRFNSNRYCTEIINPLGQSTKRDFAIGTNLLNFTTDELGRATTYTYDNNGNVTSMTDPAGNITRYQYEPTFNQLTQIEDALGNITRLGYDSNGNLITIIDPLNNLTTITYNQYGQPLTVTDALNNISTFEYDEYGNLIRTTDPLGNSATMQYDIIGRLIAATDPKGDTTLYNYDQMSRLTDVIDALNGRTRYAYNLNGNLLSVTDAKNQTITYTYNVRDKVASMIDQLSRTETYSYDMNDNLISLTDRKGQTTTYSYDKMNRIARADYADGSNTTYTYDAVGRLTTINDSVSGTISYTYSDTGCPSCGSAVDKVIQEVTPLGSISYTYDTIGRRTSMTVAGQQPATYQYDANSRLTSVVGAGLAPVQISYDALGRRTSLTYPNGVTTTYTYNSASRLLNLQHLNPLNQILESLNYIYDANGNRISMNRPSVSVPLPNPVTGATYNSANQMLTFVPQTSSAKTMTYDANGNMTSMTNGCGTTTYTWDARNRLVGIDGFKSDCTPLLASFKYDALERRIEKTINGGTIQYVYDGLDIVQEIENGIVATNYLRSLNIDEALGILRQDGTYYYIHDALGSTIALTDPSSNVVVEYYYDSFGNTQVSNPAIYNPFQYTGRENDGTGLYYYRARYYSPELQRFISEDPIGLVGGINFFTYVGNNPLRWIDPFGFQSSGRAERLCRYPCIPNAGDYTKCIDNCLKEKTEKEKWLERTVHVYLGYCAFNSAGKLPEDTPEAIGKALEATNCILEVQEWEKTKKSDISIEYTACIWKCRREYLCED